MFLSEWREFPSAPCLARKKKTWWQLASRYCWNRARPWYASELFSFLVGLRTYQHPRGISYGIENLLVINNAVLNAESSSRTDEKLTDNGGMEQGRRWWVVPGSFCLKRQEYTVNTRLCELTPLFEETGVHGEHQAVWIDTFVWRDRGTRW